MQTPPIVRSVDDIRRILRGWRAAGEKIALIPTMGGLHDGHLSLVRTARKNARRAVASIFVNPAQFGDAEDFDTYPRNEAEDVERLVAAGCDLVFAPPVEAMYPTGAATSVRVTGLTECLCGAHRPGHFDGVTTVVTILLNQVQPDFAVFGEKDWQQLVTIRRMVHDLDLPVRIVSGATVREEGGLAMSSRNDTLNPSERAIAGTLHKVLIACASHIAEGSPIPAVTAACRKLLDESGFGEIDYIEARRAWDLATLEHFDPAKPARLLAAVHLGRARLIDNVPITRSFP